MEIKHFYFIRYKIIENSALRGSKVNEYWGVIDKHPVEFMAEKQKANPTDTFFIDIYKEETAEIFDLYQNAFNRKI